MNPILEAALLLSAATFLAGTFKKPEPTGSGSHPEKSQENQRDPSVVAGDPASQAPKTTNPPQNENHTQPTGSRLVDFMLWLDVRFRFVVLTAAYIRVVYLLTRLAVYAVLWLLNPEAAAEFMRPS